MDFFKKYSGSFYELLSNLDENDFAAAIDLLKNIRKMNSKVIIVGNGGSAAIASHVSVDLTKACKIRSINFNEADLLTCFANDYGYENWVVEALKAYAEPNDLIILISSSGKSQNIVNAANYCNMKGLKLITLSGFKKNNPLSELGGVNVWIDSDYYNFVEMAHHLWLVALVDQIAIGDNMLS
jgi:D-sedoheptulose 7-phosphate isomerase